MSDTDTNPLAGLPGFFLANNMNDPRVNQQLRQRIALQLMQNKRPYPKTVGEGLSAIGDALAQRGMADQLARSDIASREAAPGLVAGVGGGAGPPVPPAAAPPGAAPVTRSYAPDESTVFPPVSDTAVSEPAGDGGYNFMDAQARHGLPPMQGRMQGAITGATDSPDMQAYLGALSAREQAAPGQVSPTGAAGPFQFTRGTGRGYGLMDQGDQRGDPVASSKAAVQLTEDNAAIFRRMTGREPTMADLALMHQQGGTTGTRMIQGTGNASPENLRVNNVPPGATPQQATAAIKRYYGMPEAPIDPREAVTRSMVAQNDGGQALAFAPEPPPQQITPAPQQPQQIISLPRGELQTQPAGVQQPGDIPGYVPPEPMAPTQPKPTDMSEREIKLRNFIAVTPNDYARSLAQGELQVLEARRTAQDTHNSEMWKKELEHYNTMRLERQKALMDQSKRITDVAKDRQTLVGQPGPAGTDQRLLGTPQSPQRSGVPSLPPVPQGISPQKWSEQQAPEMVKAINAYEKADRSFGDALKLLQMARTHPGREWGTGPTANWAGATPGTAAFGFKQIMDQMAGKNFLAAYEQLKGGGQITEIEGSKAEAAQARLARAQNKQDFDRALNEFEIALREDMERAQRKVNRPVTAWRGPDDNASHAPDIGQRGTRGGRAVEYIGGNPYLDSSYRPVQ